MKTKHIFRQIRNGFILAVLISGSAVAATVSRDFKTSQTLSKGTIVSLENNASQVVSANQDNIANIYGVVVPKGDLSFDQTGATGGTAAVANEGVVDTLVSDNNGPINAGDSVTVENINGVGQKATKSGRVVGIAQGSLDQTAQSYKEVQVDGKTVKIALVPVKIGVSEFNPNSGAGNSQEEVNNRNKALQIADSFAGKEVKPFALLIAGLLLLVSIFVSVFLVTSSGYASMISIGRNPLSQKTIIRSLVRMVLIAVAIFVIGLALSYAVLKLL